MDIMIDTPPLPNEAQQLRETTKLSIQHLASLLGVSRYTYHKWLKGKPISKHRIGRVRELLAAASLGWNPATQKPEPHLTKRERDVLCLIARGWKDEEIASVLCMVTSTARTHVKHLLDKLFLSNRTELAIYALKTGIVALDEIELRHTERK